MMTDKKIIQTVVLAGIVVREGKILIVQRHANEVVLPNIWELPSGKREPLEKSSHSLLREIREETGLEVEIIKPLSVFDYQIKKSHEIRDTTQINFLVRPKDNSQVRLSHEHQAFAWIDAGQVDEFEISKPVREVIHIAFKLIDSPSF
jgi:8-oxo-dGTP diphosphatase